MCYRFENKTISTSNIPIYNIITGLRDDALSDSLSSIPFSSTEDLLLRLNHFERHRQMSNQRVSKKRSYETAFRQPREVSGTQNRDKRTCFNCYETGHISIHCLKPQRRQRCQKCQRTGHFESQYQLNMISSSGQIGTHKVNMIINKPNEYFKTVLIQDNGLIAFIDMGSDCSLTK